MIVFVTFRVNGVGNMTSVMSTCWIILVWFMSGWCSRAWSRARMLGVMLFPRNCAWLMTMVTS